MRVDAHRELERPNAAFAPPPMQPLGETVKEVCGSCGKNTPLLRSCAVVNPQSVVAVPQSGALSLHHFVAAHVAIAPDDFGIVAGEYVRVDHPAENFFHKSPAGCIALVSRGDTQGAKNWPPIFHFVPALVSTAGR